MTDTSVEPEALATDGDPLALQTVQLHKNGSPGMGLGWVQAGTTRKCQLGGKHPQHLRGVTVTILPAGVSVREGWL